MESEAFVSAKPCKGCGKLVVFAKDRETGKWQVLSNQAPIWKVTGHDPQGVPLVERDTKALLSHFVNCPNANDFSASKKKEEAPPAQQHFSEPKEL